MKLQPETQNQANRVPFNMVAGQSHNFGIKNDEPIIIILDACIRYAKAHEKRFESKLAEDYVLGPAWLQIATGARALLDGSGAVANERDISTDSKDNGACEGMFWDAMTISGYTEADI